MGVLGDPRAAQPHTGVCLHILFTEQSAAELLAARMETDHSSTGTVPSSIYCLPNSLMKRDMFSPRYLYLKAASQLMKMVLLPAGALAET